MTVDRLRACLAEAGTLLAAKAGAPVMSAPVAKPFRAVRQYVVRQYVVSGLSRTQNEGEYGSKVKSTGTVPRHALLVCFSGVMSTALGGAGQNRFNQPIYSHQQAMWAALDSRHEHCHALRYRNYREPRIWFAL